MDALLNTAPCGFLSFTDDGKIVVVNATLGKILDCDSDRLPGRYIEEILQLASCIFYQTHLFPLLKMHGKADEIFLSLKSRTGAVVPVLVTALRQVREGRVFNDCVFIPMNRRNEYEDQILRSKKAAEEASLQKDRINASLNDTRIALEAKEAELLKVNAKLETLAFTDALTGLKNRRAFDDHLKFQLDLAQRLSISVSILLIDVDNFKSVNDTFGHALGDTCLVAIAEILKHTARKSDFVARYGGEEFAMILPNTSQLDALAVGEKVRHAIAAERMHAIQITASVGAATLSDRITNKELLVASADQALYESKKRGRNCVTHADMMQDPKR